MNVKNNHDTPLRVGTINIRPGATVRIENWNVLKGDEQVKALLNGKYIEEVADREEPVAEEVKPKRNRE